MPEMDEATQQAHDAWRQRADIVNVQLPHEEVPTEHVLFARGEISPGLEYGITFDTVTRTLVPVRLSEVTADKPGTPSVPGQVQPLNPPTPDDTSNPPTPDDTSNPPTPDDTSA